MSKSTDEWMNWKYDLCENEIQCEGRTIAFSDNSIFDIKDKAEFNAKVRDLGMKLSWMVARANSTTKLQGQIEKMREALEGIERVITAAKATLPELDPMRMILSDHHEEIKSALASA